MRVIRDLLLGVYLGSNAHLRSTAFTNTEQLAAKLIYASTSPQQQTYYALGKGPSPMNLRRAH